MVLGSLLYTAGSAFQYATPAYLGQLRAQLGFNASQLGSITAAENSGVALASLLSILWLTRLDGRALAVAAALLCTVLNLIAIFIRQFDLVIAARFLTGLVGEGVLFALAFVVLGSTRDPNRAFGIGLTTVVTFGSLVLGVAPYLDRLLPGAGVLLPLAAAPLSIFLAVRWMPRGRSAPVMARFTATGGAAGRLAIVSIAGMAIWFAAPGAFWTFAASAAAVRHIPGDSISVALAIGNGVGLLGSAAAAWQRDRWGRFPPLALATVCLCLSVVAFEGSFSTLALAAALSAFNAFWNYAAVYEMALVTSLDRTGKVSLAISAAQVLGFAAGGFLSGWAISQTGYGTMPGVVAALAICGMTVLTLCLRMPRLAEHHG